MKILEAKTDPLILFNQSSQATVFLFQRNHLNKILLARGIYLTLDFNWHYQKTYFGESRPIFLIACQTLPL